MLFRYRERGNIEVNFFNIQAKLKANGQRMYVPPEGKLVRDIEHAWRHLEKAEHDRELALREELIRLVNGFLGKCDASLKLHGCHSSTLSISISSL